MQRSKVRVVTFCLLIALAAGLFAGCASSEEKNTELWVVTEKTEWDKMNFQVQFMADLFQEEHPGWTVKVDILPTEEPARSRYLKQLRTWIMGGRGPDVFLMPTDTTIVRSPTLSGPYIEDVVSFRVQTTELEPLFINVEQTMTNGVFADLSRFYDTDTELGTEHFQKQIMDAGCYRGGRYLLPLRYNFPVLFADPEGLKKFGLTLEDVDGNLAQLLDLAIASGNKAIATSLEPFFLQTGRGFSILPDPVGYTPETVKVTKEEVAALLKQIQSLEVLVGDANDHRHKLSLWNFIESYLVKLTNITNGKPIGKYQLTRFPTVLPMQMSFFDDCAQVAAISEAANHEYAMLPLRAVDGSQAAYVTYYGAISAGCNYVAEAYDFLRLFLTERAQYEYDTPEVDSIWTMGVFFRNSYIADGWPVRVWEGTGQIYDIIRTQPYRAIFDEGAVPMNKRKLITNHLTDEDLPLLHTEFDRVYFGCVLEQDFAQMVRSLNDPYTGEPTDVDIDAMAEEFIEKLTWHVMEG